MITNARNAKSHKSFPNKRIAKATTMMTTMTTKTTKAIISTRKPHSCVVRMEKLHRTLINKSIINDVIDLNHTIYTVCTAFSLKSPNTTKHKCTNRQRHTNWPPLHRNIAKRNRDRDSERDPLGKWVIIIIIEINDIFLAFNSINCPYNKC